MEKTSFRTGEDGDPVKSRSENKEAAKANILSKRYTRNPKPEFTLILNVKKPHASRSWGKKLLVPNVRLFHNKIPRHIISLDEKYALHCLELIQNCAFRSTAWGFGSEVDFLPNRLNVSTKLKNRSSCDDARFVIEEGPSAPGTESVIVTSDGGWTIDSVSGSESMLNILRSPLFHRFGERNLTGKLGTKSLLDVSKPDSSNLFKSPESISSSCKLKKDLVVHDQEYGSGPSHKRLISSSTNSTFSDQSSSSGSSSFFQGMLKCTWRNGLPHHVFSMDDKREVYVANSFKAAPPDDKVLDYVYTFHSRKDDDKEYNIHKLESEPGGKMRVSTTVTYCPNNSEITETQFVLYGSDSNNLTEIQNASHMQTKNKRLTKKVVNVFRSKQRSLSKFGGTSAISEDSSWDPSQDMRSTPDPGEEIDENCYVPNLELAAVIVKEHVRKNPNREESGGWGLKFLKKLGANASLDRSVSSECCPRHSSECSTSMDILLPAGYHGGPRTRIGGPSSLIERWKSGGRCDCGGWDIGCPLAELRPRMNSKESSIQAESFEECKSFDIFLQNSKQNAPVMKMVNIHDGLYYIHFQPTLSTLQCFAIASAVIHTRSPILRPKVYRS